VIEAVERGQFHIYPIRTIFEGSLADRHPGWHSEEAGTVNGSGTRCPRELALNLGIGTSGMAGRPAQQKTTGDDER
jgi:hypothetical protein